MFEDAISLLSLFTSLNSWLTPTVLFLFLNLMIGTIALTSGGFSSHKPNHHHHHHHIHHPQPILHHHHHPQPILHPHHHIIHYPQPPPLLQVQPPTFTPSPSIVQRLKSTINFSSFYSQQLNFQPPPPPQQQQFEHEPEPEPKPELKVEHNTTSNDDDEGLTLDEVYSRIKQVDINHPHYGRQNSDTKPSNGEIPVKLPQKMMKFASDKSAFNHFHLQDGILTTTTTQYVPTKIKDEILDGNNNVDENVVGAAIMEDDNDEADVEERELEEEEEEGVDAKADDFINRFKKQLQLQLQRNESMLRQL